MRRCRPCSSSSEPHTAKGTPRSEHRRHADRLRCLSRQCRAHAAGRLSMRRGRDRTGLRHPRRVHHLGRSCGAGRGLAHGLCRSRLWAWPPRRPAAREPAGLPVPLVRAECAGRQCGADQRRAACRGTRIPDRPQRDRPGHHVATTGRRFARRSGPGRHTVPDCRTQRRSRQRPDLATRCQLRPARWRAHRCRHRMRLALHLGHDRSAQGLHAQQCVFRTCRPVVWRTR